MPREGKSTAPKTTVTEKAYHSIKRGSCWETISDGYVSLGNGDPPEVRHRPDTLS
jgi:hypothetical protein